MPLVKWLLPIPHFIVLILLAIGALFAILISFFAVLFTAPLPAWAVRLRSGRLSLGLASAGVPAADGGPVSAVLAR